MTANDEGKHKVIPVRRELLETGDWHCDAWVFGLHRPLKHSDTNTERSSIRCELRSLNPKPHSMLIKTAHESLNQKGGAHIPMQTFDCCLRVLQISEQILVMVGLQP